MNDYNLFRKISEEFSKSISLAKDLENPEIKQDLINDQARFDQKEIYFAITGEVSSGKSSLINGILNDKLCPVDAPATTSSISLIRWATKEKIIVHYTERGAAKAKIIEREEIASYVTEINNKKNEKEVKLLEINTPNPILKDGLVLIDTPGLGTLNPLHSVATFSIAPSADSLIFVSDCQAELKDEEIKFLNKLNKNRLSQSFLHVITKSDLQTDDGLEDIVETNLSHISNGLGWLKSEIKIIAVSAEEYHEAVDEKDKILSGFPKLFNFLNYLNKNTEKILARNYAKRIQLKCLTLLQPLNIEEQGIVATAKNELEELKKKMNELNDKLYTLLNAKAIWRIDLKTDIENFKIETIRKINKDYKKYKEKFEEEYLNDPAVLNDPSKELQIAIPGDIAMIAGRYPALIKEGLTRIYEDLIERTNIKAYLNYSHSPEQAQGGGDIKTINSSWTDTAMTISKGVATGVFAGSTGVGVIGGIIGGIIGTFTAPGAGTIAGAKLGAVIGANLGAVLGAVKGFFMGQEAVKEGKKNKIRKTISPIIKNAHEGLKENVSGILTESGKQLENSFMMQLNQVQKNIEQSIKNLENVSNLTSQEAESRLAKINEFQIRLTNVIDNCQSVIQKSI